MDKTIGITADEASSICQEHGFMSAFFGPGEKVDMSEMDSSYEWLLFRTDANGITVEEIDEDGKPLEDD